MAEAVTPSTLRTPFVGSKEESFVTDDRGSDTAAKLVLAQLRFCQVAASTKGIVAGIEDVVAEIFIEESHAVGFAPDLVMTSMTAPALHAIS